MKRVVKGFFLFLASVTYMLLLFLTAGMLEARLTLADSTTMKGWLVDSGVYKSVVEEVSKNARIDQQKDSTSARLTTQDITDAAQASFSATSVQRDSESIIDGFYGWLKGDTSSPTFKVDLGARQADFAKVLTDKLEEKINALPACTTTGKFTAQAFDLFSSDCKPKGVDLTAKLTAFENDIATNSSILPQTVFTGDDLRLTGSNGSKQSIGSALSWPPRAYKLLLWGPVCIGILTLVAILSLVFLSSSRRRGLRRAAWGLVFVGTVLVVSGFLLGPAFGKLNTWSSKAIGTDGSVNQHIVNPLFEQFNKTYSRYNIIIGVAYLIPALVMYGGLLITRSRKEHDTTEPQAFEHPRHEYVESEATVDTMPQQNVANEETANFIEEQPTSVPPQPVAETVPQATATPVARSAQRPVTRRPPMIQG